ncbi:Zinc/iron permease [Spinellus fusiger]|nr:Zinc/iron permease [Spinellus fusiger]
MILHRIRPYHAGSIRDWLLTVGKFFGTGVILATAFIHMLPEALSNFDSPCLSEGWQSYGAFAGVFCMISSFALQLLELAAVSNMDKIHTQRQAEQKTLDLEKTDVSSTTLVSDLNPSTTSHHGHVHGAGLLEDDQSFRNIGTLMLELGIVMHSIIVGITLANTGNEEFVTLLIALVFHQVRRCTTFFFHAWTNNKQFFEGVALGTRVNEMNHKSWTKPALMGTLFMLMTPIGIAIGIAIHSSFNPNSSSAILASAILDSLSAGILLYNAYVSLMSMEINHNVEFRRSSLIRKVVSFLSMYLGAALMALIGKWA